MLSNSFSNKALKLINEPHTECCDTQYETLQTDQLLEIHNAI